MENENGPLKPSNESDPGVKFGPSTADKVVIAIQLVLLAVILVVVVIALGSI